MARSRKSGAGKGAQKGDGSTNPSPIEIINTIAGPGAIKMLLWYAVLFFALVLCVVALFVFAELQTAMIAFGFLIIGAAFAGARAAVTRRYRNLQVTDDPSTLLQRLEELWSLLGAQEHMAAMAAAGALHSRAAELGELLTLLDVRTIGAARTAIPKLTEARRTAGDLASLLRALGAESLVAGLDRVATMKKMESELGFLRGLLGAADPAAREKIIARLPVKDPPASVIALAGLLGLRDEVNAVLLAFTLDGLPALHVRLTNDAERLTSVGDGLQKLLAALKADGVEAGILAVTNLETAASDARRAAEQAKLEAGEANRMFQEEQTAHRDAKEELRVLRGTSVPIPVLPQVEQPVVAQPAITDQELARLRGLDQAMVELRKQLEAAQQAEANAKRELLAAQAVGAEVSELRAKLDRTQSQLHIANAAVTTANGQRQGTLKIVTRQVETLQAMLSRLGLLREWDELEDGLVALLDPKAQLWIANGPSAYHRAARRLRFEIDRLTARLFAAASLAAAGKWEVMEQLFRRIVTPKAFDAAFTDLNGSVRVWIAESYRRPTADAQ